MRKGGCRKPNLWGGRELFRETFTEVYKQSKLMLDNIHGKAPTDISNCCLESSAPT